MPGFKSFFSEIHPAVTAVGCLEKVLEPRGIAPCSRLAIFPTADSSYSNKTLPTDPVVAYPRENGGSQPNNEDYMMKKLSVILLLAVSMSHSIQSEADADYSLEWDLIGVNVEGINFTVLQLNLDINQISLPIHGIATTSDGTAINIYGSCYFTVADGLWCNASMGPYSATLDVDIANNLRVEVEITDPDGFVLDTGVAVLYGFN